MPEDKTNQLPDDGDVKGPKPPTNPVEYSRWLQRPQVTPKKPKVQPDGSALRIDSLKRPDVNRSIGTDKPKRSKLKNPNNTRLPAYLKPNKGIKTAPGAESGNLIKFMEWLDESGVGVELNKMSPTTLAAFGLGWYISDTLTRDEKQSWQKKLDDEFNRSVERQEASNVMLRSSRKLKKSAYDELQDYYQELMG